MMIGVHWVTFAAGPLFFGITCSGVMVLTLCSVDIQIQLFNPANKTMTVPAIIQILVARIVDGWACFTRGQFPYSSPYWHSVPAIFPPIFPQFPLNFPPVLLLYPKALLKCPALGITLV